MAHFSIRPCLAVLGLGDPARMDKGVGVHVARELQKAPLHEVLVAEVGDCITGALHWFKCTDTVVVIGAVQAGGLPGTFYWLSARDPRPEMISSLRDLGIMEALERLPDPLNPRVMVLGIEPAEVGCGKNLSRELLNVLPRIVSTARGIAGELVRRGPAEFRPERAHTMARQMMG